MNDMNIKTVKTDGYFLTDFFAILWYVQIKKIHVNVFEVINEKPLNSIRNLRFIRFFIRIKFLEKKEKRMVK